MTVALGVFTAACIILLAITFFVMMAAISRAVERIKELEAALAEADYPAKISHLEVRSAVIEGMAAFHRDLYLHPPKAVVGFIDQETLHKGLADTIAEHVEAKLNRGGCRA